MGNSTYSHSNIRASLRKFALGKAITAPGTFLLVFVLAATMPGPEYAAYVVAASGMELALAISTLGLDWLMQTAVPSARTHGNSRQLRKLVAALAVLQALPYIVCGACFWLFSGVISRAFGGVAPPELIEFYGFIVIAEGLGGRMLRDQILSALLMQGIVQPLSLLRLLIMGGSVLWFWSEGHTITALDIAGVEMAAAVMTLLGGGIALLHYLRSSPSGDESTDSSIRRWFGRDSFRLARHAYGSFLLTLCLSAELATVFVARYLGADATAAFGFTIRVVDQIRRFLPMDLLWSLIRPALVGRYETYGRSFQILAKDVTLVLRANLLLLGGATVVFFGIGEQLIATVTHGKVQLPAFLLAAFLPQVVGHSARRSVELMSFVTGQSRLFLRGAIASLAAPLLFVVLVPLWPNLYMVALGMTVAEALFCGIVAVGLHRAGYHLQIKVSQWVALAVVVQACGLAAALICREWPTVPGMIAAAGVGGLAYLASLPLIGLATRRDVGLLMAMVRPRPSGAA
jgi:hypothetical protein